MNPIINAAMAVASVGMMVVFSGTGFAQCTTAVVDMQVAVTTSNEGKAQSTKFDAHVAEWQAKLSSIRKDISAAQNKLNAQPGMPRQVIDDLNETIRNKTVELTLALSDAQKDVDNYRESLLSPIM